MIDGRLIYLFIYVRKYNCFCRCVHLRTAAAIICFNDLLLLIPPAVEGYHLYSINMSNPVATAWFVSSATMLGIAVFTILFAWYGVYRERSLWILPKCVLKVFMIIIYSAMCCVVCYLVYTADPLLTNLILDNMDVSVRAAKSTVKTIGLGVCLIIIAVIVLQCWFFCILLDSYRYIRARELTRKMEKYEETLQNEAYQERTPVEDRPKAWRTPVDGREGLPGGFDRRKRVSFAEKGEVDYDNDGNNNMNQTCSTYTMHTSESRSQYDSLV